MRIAVVTPAPAGSRAGNRATALRWARVLRSLGHRVSIGPEYTAQRCDVLVALHAWRSAKSITAFRERHSKRPLILALTGTDVYRFLVSDPVVTLNSMRQADRLIGLHELVGEALPESERQKLRIIYQSAKASARREGSAASRSSLPAIAAVQPCASSALWPRTRRGIWGACEN